MSTLPQTSTDETANAGSPELVATAIDQVARPSQMWWRIADVAVLGVYASVVLWTIQYHEKWADEAQAWLIARDLDLRTIWFHELRYEGSPGLWHTILWIAQRAFHAHYDSISYIGAAFAIAGVAFMLVKAPFPRPLRWMLAFTYFMVYQYAVIARPYNLLPLLCFAAAALFRDLKHPERMTVVLVVLANLTIHGTIIAGCLGLAYLIDAIRFWTTLEERVKARYVLCVGAMLITFLFLFVILQPTPDVGEFAPKPSFGGAPQPAPTFKLLASVAWAFFDHPIPSFLFIVLAGAWCFVRGRGLTFALPVALTIALYARVHGYAHHHGTIFVAAITGLWIAWPDGREIGALSKRGRWAFGGITLSLVCLFAVNIWDSAVVIRREYLYPYSGGQDAAKYLKSIGADRGSVFGFLFGTVAVQAYFDHNIFANVPTSYFHQGLPFTGNQLDVDQLRRINPDYLVVYSVDPQLMLDTNGPIWASLGYQMVHFSDGYYLYKRRVYERETYFIYRRVAR